MTTNRIEQNPKSDQRISSEATMKIVHSHVYIAISWYEYCLIVIKRIDSLCFFLVEFVIKSISLCLNGMACSVVWNAITAPYFRHDCKIDLISFALFNYVYLFFVCACCCCCCRSSSYSSPFFWRIIKFIYMTCTYICSHPILCKITHVHNENGIVLRCDCVYAHDLSRQQIALPMDTGNQIHCVRLRVVCWSIGQQTIRIIRPQISLYSSRKFPLCFSFHRIRWPFFEHITVTARKNMSTSDWLRVW